MTTLSLIRTDMMFAMKAKETLKLSTIRMIMSSIQTARADLKLSDVSDMTEDQVIEIVASYHKTVVQQINELDKAGRDSSKQQEELKIVEKYLPVLMSEEEIVKVVNEVIEGMESFSLNTGLVMKEMSQRLKGKAEMKLVNKIVRETLSV